MADEKALRPLSRYLEFGVKRHLEDFLQVTVTVLLIYLPFALVALFLHPSMRSLVKSGAQTFSVLPRMVAAQVLLRLLQVFVFILLILRLEARRKGEENVWDLAEAFSRMRQVAPVDLAYAFGLQLLAVLLLWLSLTVAGALLGESPLSLPLAFTITAFSVLAPAVRYYFCSLTALLYGEGFLASFQRAGALSAGGERLIVLLVLTYLFVWFMFWQVLLGMFGTGFFGQFLVHAAIMVSSVSYFFAGYGLFMDLVPGASSGGRGGGDGAGTLPPGAGPEADEERDPRR